MFKLLVRKIPENQACAIVANPFSRPLSVKNCQLLINKTLSIVKQLNEQGFLYFQTLLGSGIEIGAVHTLINSPKKDNASRMKHVFFEPYSLWSVEQLLTQAKPFRDMFAEILDKSFRSSKVCYASDINLPDDENITCCIQKMLKQSFYLIAIKNYNSNDGYVAQAISFANNQHIPVSILSDNSIR